MDKKYFNLIFIIKGNPGQIITARAGYQPFSVSFNFLKRENHPAHGLAVPFLRRDKAA
jgi:hypothetical protein